MSEILSAIKFIKLYAWEKTFARAVAGLLFYSNNSSLLGVEQALLFRLHLTLSELCIKPSLFIEICDCRSAAARFDTRQEV